jgi:hypothetical protein
MRFFDGMARAFSAAIGALLAGCGPAPYAMGPEEPAAAPTPTPPVYVVVGEARPAAPAREPQDRWLPEPRPNPFATRRTWVGDYDCTQGRTGLALRIVDVRGDKVRAIFDFHHAPSDAAGQYLVAGTYDEGTGQVVFTPGPWIIHPDDYVSVGMEGRVSRDGAHFAGRITFPGCGGFRLQAAR